MKFSQFINFKNNNYNFILVIINWLIKLDTNGIFFKYYNLKYNLFKFIVNSYYLVFKSRLKQNLYIMHKISILNINNLKLFLHTTYMLFIKKILKKYYY